MFRKEINKLVNAALPAKWGKQATTTEGKRNNWKCTGCHVEGEENGKEW